MIKLKKITNNDLLFCEIHRTRRKATLNEDFSTFNFTEKEAKELKKQLDDLLEGK